MTISQDHEPTAEQAEIVVQARTTSDNLLLTAYAGCGKTTTLELLERHVKQKPILYLAFNKKIAEDATKRMASTTSVRTLNGMGHRIWDQGRNLKLDTKKSQAIFKEIIDASPKSAQGPMWDSYWAVIQGVALAKALGYIPEGIFPSARRLISSGPFHARLEEAPDDLTADLIDAVLSRSITAAYKGHIDFNDQVYMPALFGAVCPRFPLVAVDEVQDLNPVNHALLDKLAKGRLIGVGDDFQAIYQFRGAMQGGMDSLRGRFNMATLPLSTSFRCPRAVVESARWRVPNFNWIKDGGHVETLDRLDASTIDEDSAIICRNNAPLFKLALNLLSNGRSVSVAGSDIGPKIIGIMRRLGADDASQGTVLSAIDDWLAEREDRGSTTAHDIAECMRVFTMYGTTLNHAILHAEHLFAQSGTLRLMTGHKAKGLEFDTVYHLDPWLCRMDEEQDQNLRYVIQTRSLDTYYEVDSNQIQW